MGAKTKKSKNKITTKRTLKKVLPNFIAPKNNPALDEAVPVNLLLNKKSLGNKPKIKLSVHHSLSPFVVSFSEPEKTAEINNPNWQLNFVLPEKELINPTKETNLLSLNQNELSKQFLEEEFTPNPFHKTNPIINFPWPSWLAVREAIQNFQKKNHIHEPIVEPLNWRSLELSTKSETLEEALPFDLPEIENNENEESEILTWDDVVRSIIPEEKIEDFQKSFAYNPNFTEENGKENFNQKKNYWSEKFTNFKIFLQKKSFRGQEIFSALLNQSKKIKLPIINVLPSGWHRALAVFVLLSFAFVLPLHAMETIRDLQGAKNNLTNNGLAAAEKLNLAMASLLSTNSAAAAESFAAAEKDFSNAQSVINDLGTATSFILSILPTTRTSFRSGESLIKAGENLAAAGKKISEGLATAQDKNLDNTGRLAILTQTFESSVPLLEAANKNLQKVDINILPNEYQKQFSELKKTLPDFLTTAKEVTEFSQTLSTLLGSEGKKRYLLLFQNNMELRPTGGFIGSFALLDISHGEVTNLEIPAGGSYDLQGSLKTNLVAPLPLQLLSARWEFQDANWFPDFPTSARQVLEFYQDAGGPTVDGVVAINASFVNSLLSILGPIEMPEYDQTIDSENFLFTTQKIVEYDYVNYQKNNSDRKEAAPKAFIGDLASTMFNKIKELDASTFLKTLSFARQGLDEKNIQLYFENENLQKTVLDFNWGGEIKNAEKDFLMVVDTNLGGGKTDGVIKENINLSVAIQNDGTIINTLTISRQHQGIPGALFTGVNNVDFLRVYVPKGSQLLSATGFTPPDSSLFEIPDENWTNDSDISSLEEMALVDHNNSTIIYEENGKTAFGNWIQTKPGESSVVTLVYQLPFSLTTTEPNFLQMVKNKIGLNDSSSYSLLIQKQSGVLDRSTTISVSPPNVWKTVWSSEKNIFDNSSDQLFSTIFESF